MTSILENYYGYRDQNHRKTKKYKVILVMTILLLIVFGIYKGVMYMINTHTSDGTITHKNYYPSYYTTVYCSDIYMDFNGNPSFSRYPCGEKLVPERWNLSYERWDKKHDWMRVGNCTVPQDLHDKAQIGQYFDCERMLLE